MLVKVPLEVPLADRLVPDQDSRGKKFRQKNAAGRLSGGAKGRDR
jgi:hypothetical protein